MKRRLPGDEAFELYFSLGDGRCYRDVADHYGVSKAAVAARATKDGWQKRLQEREERARAHADDRAVETLETVNRRHLAALRAIQVKALEALRSMSINTAMEAVRALDIAIKQERLVLGEPTDRSAVSVEDVIRGEYERWMIRDEPWDDLEEEDGAA